MTAGAGKQHVVTDATTITFAIASTFIDVNITMSIVSTAIALTEGLQTCPEQASHGSAQLALAAVHQQHIW